MRDATRQPEYIPLYWSHELRCEYIKGHTDEAMARAILERETGLGSDVTFTIRHGWARFVPVTSRDYDTELNECAGPARGAFAVTVVEFGVAEKKGDG